MDCNVRSSSWEERLREERLREDDFIAGNILKFDTVLKELWKETFKKYHYDVLILLTVRKRPPCESVGLFAAFLDFLPVTPFQRRENFVEIGATGLFGVIRCGPMETLFLRCYIGRAGHSGGQI